MDDLLLPISRLLYQRRQSKVPNFDVHLVIQEQIPQFEITMDDVCLVHVLTSSDELDEDHASFWLCVAFTLAE